MCRLNCFAFCKHISRTLTPAFLLVLLVGAHFSTASTKKLLGFRGLKQAEQVPVDDATDDSAVIDGSDSAEHHVGDKPSYPDVPRYPSADTDSPISPHDEDGPTKPPLGPALISSYPSWPAAPPVYGSPSPPYWPNYPSRAPRAAWDEVFDLVKGAASDFGLYKAVTFFQEAVPAFGRILEDAPVAVLYIHRLFKYGVPSGFHGSPGIYGSDSDMEATMHSIIQPTIGAILNTDTGSLLADRIAMEQGVDLAAAATSRNFRELLPVFNDGIWAQLGEDYGPATATLTTINLFKSMAVYLLSPYGQRITFPQVAADIVSASLALVTNVVGNADALRKAADSEMSMSDEEYDAFAELKHNLRTIQDALARLDDSLRV